MRLQLVLASFTISLFTSISLRAEDLAALTQSTSEPEILETPIPDDDPHCPPCVPLIVVTLNGINADVSHPIYGWMMDNTPGSVFPMDLFSGPAEFCNANPSAGAAFVQHHIALLRRDNPCAKIMVVGHSMGAIAAAYLGLESDCTVLLDPPPCDRMGQLFCESMRDTCNRWDNGLADEEGYVDLEVHDPFLDPLQNCQDLNRVEGAIDSCVERLRPSTVCNNEVPNDQADCQPTPTPTPRVVPTRPTGCREGLGAYCTATPAPQSPEY